MRWRAKYCGTYYIINRFGKVESVVEVGELFDQHQYNSGNYFQTEKEAINSKFFNK